MGRCEANFWEEGFHISDFLKIFLQVTKKITKIFHKASLTAIK